MSEIKDRCADCEYYATLEHNFKVGTGYEVSHCCILFARPPYAEDGKESVLQVSPNALGEMFVEKK